MRRQKRDSIVVPKFFVRQDEMDKALALSVQRLGAKTYAPW